jgi:hypothetical protein
MAIIFQLNASISTITLSFGGNLISSIAIFYDLMPDFIECGEADVYANSVDDITFVVYILPSATTIENHSISENDAAKIASNLTTSIALLIGQGVHLSTSFIPIQVSVTTCDNGTTSLLQIQCSVERSSQPESSSGLSNGQIAGIVIGAVTVMTCVVTLVYFAFIYGRKHNDDDSSNKRDIRYQSAACYASDASPSPQARDDTAEDARTYTDNELAVHMTN